MGYRGRGENSLIKYLTTSDTKNYTFIKHPWNWVWKAASAVCLRPCSWRIDFCFQWNATVLLPNICDRKFLPVTGNFFLRQEISSCGTKFLTQNFFPTQDISAIFHPYDIKSRLKCVIFGYISKSRQKYVNFAQNFAWEFKASQQDSCHLTR